MRRYKFESLNYKIHGIGYIKGRRLLDNQNGYDQSTAGFR